MRALSTPPLGVVWTVLLIFKMLELGSISALHGLTASDWGTVAGLLGIEAPMSFDNALVMLTLVSTLEGKDKRNAILLGMAGAWVLRLAGLLVANAILAIPLCLLLAGGYLLHLTADFFTQDHDEKKTAAASAFWPAVGTMVITNLAFSIDNYAGAYALTSDAFLILIAISIAMVALTLCILVAQDLVDKFPAVEPTAYMVVGVAGLLVFYEEIPSLLHLAHHSLPEVVKVAFVIITLIVGYAIAASGLSKKLGWALRPIHTLLEWYEQTWTLPVRVLKSVKAEETETETH